MHGCAKCPAWGCGPIACSSRGGGVACGEAGVGAAVACGLAFAAVLREHPANITITKIDTARRTRIPLSDAVIESEYVLRERWSTGRFSRRGRGLWGPAPSLVLIPIEFALVAKQPLFAHSGQRRLSRYASNDCEQHRDERPAENGLENPPTRAVGKREALDVRGHDLPRVVSTTMPMKALEKPRVILRFLRMRAPARRKQGTYGKAR